MSLETPKELAQLLARDAERVCQTLWPNGKREGKEWRVGDVYGSAGHSLSCELTGTKAGAWRDWAEDSHRGDLLDAWAMRYGINLGEAMQQVKAFLGIAPEPQLKKAKPVKTAQRPKASKPVLPKSPVMAYLHGRGLTPETIKAFHILEQPNSWKNHPDNPADIVFPYLIKDSKSKTGLTLLNNKYLALKREPNPNGPPTKITRAEGNGCKLWLFGWHLIPPNARKVVICEGECFPGSAEVLTPDGWVRFDQYSGEKVAQWEENGSLTFVDPIAKIEKHWEGSLIKRKWRGYCSETTPGHKIVSIRLNGEIYTHTAEGGPDSTAHKIPRCGVLDGEGIPLTDSQIALCIAVSADAAIDQRKGMYLDSPSRNQPEEKRYARFGFKRERKIDRLRRLLLECGINASDTKIGNGYQSICFGIPDWIPGRFLPWAWISQANVRQREFIISELTHWDGNSVPNRDMTEYVSKYFENASWVQSLAHTSGRCSSIVCRKNQHGKWFKTTILNNKNTSSWQLYKEKTQYIDYCGMVYCVQVPSGMMLIRQDQRITVTGNCDAMTWHQVGAPALSVPNGATSLTWIENEGDNLNRFDEIFLSFDMDSAGEAGIREILIRLGTHRCRIVSLPAPYKDANECLQNGFTDHDFLDCLRRSTYQQPEEFLTFQDGMGLVIESQRKAALRGNIPEGLMLPWPKATQFFMCPGHLSVWTGFGGHGKTTLISHLIASIICKTDSEKVCIASLEMTATDTLERLCAQLTGRSIMALSECELEYLGEAIQDRCVVYHHIGQSTLSKLLEIFAYARRRHGVTQFVVDSLMMLGIGHEDYDRQVAASQQLITFARDNYAHIHLVAHPKKPTDESKMPSMYDVKGSGGLVDGAHNVLVVWKNKRKAEAQQDALINGVPLDPKLQAEPDTTISIQKNRLNGWNATIPLWFHKESQQFMENSYDLPIIYTQPVASGGHF